MTTVDENTGYGNIDKDDFVKLLERNGFQINSEKKISLNYKIEKVFIDNFIKSTYVNDFPEVVGEIREEFLKEYIRRIEELSKLVSS